MKLTRKLRSKYYDLKYSIKNIIGFFRPLKDIENIKKSPFIMLEKSNYFGKVKYGVPYYYPRKWEPYIFKIRKEKIKYSSSKYIKIFGYYIYYGTPIKIGYVDLGWKDKWDSPRFEWMPMKYLFIGPFQWIKSYKIEDEDEYFEMYLWWKYYANEDIVKAKETWYGGKIHKYKDGNLIEIKESWDIKYLK